MTVPDEARPACAVPPGVTEIARVLVSYLPDWDDRPIWELAAHLAAAAAPAIRATVRAEVRQLAADRGAYYPEDPADPLGSHRRPFADLLAGPPPGRGGAT